MTNYSSDRVSALISAALSDRFEFSDAEFDVAFLDACVDAEEDVFAALSDSDLTSEDVGGDERALAAIRVSEPRDYIAWMAMIDERAA